MKAKISQLIRLSGLIAGVALALGGGRATAASNSGSTAAAAPNQPAPASNPELAAAVESMPVFDSYIKLSGYAPSVTGNEAAFQRRAQQSADGGFGVEDLRYLRTLDTGVNLEVDGRALTGSEDYLAHVRTAKDEVGSLDIGYKKFRTFYDGIGGFYPQNGRWNALTPEDLAVDRAKFWVEGKLAAPNAPEFTLRFTSDLRNGQKDSTIWGDSDFTGLPNNVPPISQVRKMVPSWIDLDERHWMIEGTMRQVLGKTTYEIGLVKEQVDTFNVRHVTRFPGEVRPFPTPPSTVLQPPERMNNQVVITHAEGIIADSFRLIGRLDFAFSDKLTLRLAASTEDLSSTVSGYRTLVTSTPTATGVVPVTTAQFTNLTGGSEIDVITGSVALDYKATSDLRVKVALRGESKQSEGQSAYDVIAASGTPALTLTTTPRVARATLDEDSWTPVLDVRYSGLRNIALYFSGSLRSLDGAEENTSAYNPLTATTGTQALQNVSEDHGDYTLGATWHASSALEFRGELFRRNHENGVVGYGARTGDNYLVDSNFTGGKVSAVVKVGPALSFTTRYIYQKGLAQVTGYLPTFPAYDSCDAENNTISESIDWAPNQQVYVQLNANVVYNVIGTVYPRAGFTPPTSTNQGFNTNNVLQNSDNNYVSGNIVTGWAATRKADVQLQLTYYKADNGNAYLAPLTLPYGVSTKEYVATVGLKYKLSEKVLLHAKAGYFDSVNDTTGGYTDFSGPMAYLSFEFGL